MTTVPMEEQLIELKRTANELLKRSNTLLAKRDAIYPAIFKETEATRVASTPAQLEEAAKRHHALQGHWDVAQIRLLSTVQAIRAVLGDDVQVMVPKLKHGLYIATELVYCEAPGVYYT